MNYNIQQDNYEIKKYFNIRKKIINYFKPKNNEDYIYYNNLSNIFINIIYLRCKYNKKTEKIIFEKINKTNNKNLINLIPQDYSNLKIKELKDLLKKKGLSTVGKKEILINRLKSI